VREVEGFEEDDAGAEEGGVGDDGIGGVDGEAVDANQSDSLVDEIVGGVFGEVGGNVGQGAGANPLGVVGLE